MVLVPDSPQWDATSEKNILLPYNHLSEQTQGKNLRWLLIQTFNLVLKVPSVDLERIEAVIDTLHLSSLLIDDIEDNSRLRRSKPCAHLIYGVPQTINCSNYMYFVAMRQLNDAFVEDKRLIAQNIFLEEMIHLHRGQGLDLYWRDNNECPTEDQYVDMVMCKTGGLFRLSTKLMNLVSDTPSEHLVTLSNLLGIIYQIKDDYLNLQSDLYNHNKGYCEDITEGKFSFPIIHSINSNPDKSELLNILKLRTEDHQLKAYALHIMETTNSFQYCRDSIEDLKHQAEQVIKKVTSDPSIAQTLLRTLDKLSSLETDHH
ncbi:hypothetical protein OGAPHI_003193 [Ogataea philodendri]|uniref:Geranylgeranyl pyrophosphate synthase n=1 Tax=Ogataea philodendri TaxID=1378263 RepID=A0A9P8P874_9ASCO|nr:uncharacterized protein OGAPHI_003193 [Ogataea philodendri]KAH3666744.1 hypothetical protein OGAPHI_003193 [Ogataea philodendri]